MVQVCSGAKGLNGEEKETICMLMFVLNFCCTLALEQVLRSDRKEAAVAAAAARVQKIQEALQWTFDKAES